MQSTNEHIGRQMYSLKTNANYVESECPVIVSLCYYAIFIIAGRLLRHAVFRHVPSPYRSYFLDMVTTAQVLGCSLENSQIRECYGYTAYFLVIYCLSFWHLLTLDSSTANPCCHIIKYVQGKSSWHAVILAISAQCVGAALSWQIARLLWLPGLTAGHRQKLNRLNCQTDLTVSVYKGVLIESFACVVNCLLSIKTFTKYRAVEQHFKIILLCLITVAGIPYTGLYMNPLNASNQTLTCQGNTWFEHLLVYWIGPCLAVSLTTILFSPINSKKDS